MSDHREALYEIAGMCLQSTTYTRRTQAIHETAMVALGMTASQRNERHTRAQKHADDHRAKRVARIIENKERNAA